MGKRTRSRTDQCDGTLQMTWECERRARTRRARVLPTHSRRCKSCKVCRHEYRCLLKLLDTKTQHTVNSMHITILCFALALQSSPSNANTSHATGTARSPHRIHSLPVNKQQKSSLPTHTHTFTTLSLASAVCSLSRKPLKRFA